MWSVCSRQKQLLSLNRKRGKKKKKEGRTKERERRRKGENTKSGKKKKRRRRSADKGALASKRAREDEKEFVSVFVHSLVIFLGALKSSGSGAAGGSDCAPSDKAMQPQIPLFLS